MPTKLTYSKIQKTWFFGLFLTQKSVFCDFTPGNSEISLRNHFKSILWSKIRLEKCIWSLSRIEQKMPVRASTINGLLLASLTNRISAGSRNPLRTSTWCGLVGTNGRCAPLLSAKVGICQLKISIGTRKSTLTATKHQDNSLSDIRLQDSTRTMMTRWRFAEDFSRRPH